MSDRGLKPAWDKFRLVDVTPTLVAELTKEIRKGSTPEGAARILGIPRKTFRRWMQEGQDQVLAAYEQQDRSLAIERQALMYLAVEHAAAKKAQDLGKHVQSGAVEWRAAAWLLERLERDDFQATERVDVTIGGSDEPVLIEGRAVVGLANVLEFVRQIGQPHLLDALDAGDSRKGLPAAGALLPDPPDGERPAGDVPAPEQA